MKTHLGQGYSCACVMSFFQGFCLLVAGLLCLLAVPSIANAATHYVDPVAGRDDNPGTSDQPWKTIAYAEEHADTGSTVYLRSGDYGNVIINGTGNSGRTRWDDAVTFLPCPGDSPTINTIYIEGPVARYLVFDGLLVDCRLADGATSPLHIHSGQYIKFQNCEIRGILGKDAEGRYSVANSSASLVEIGHFVTSSGVGSIIVRGCHIHHGGSTGVGIRGPCIGDLWIQSNKIHDFGSSGIATGGATNNYRTYLQDNEVHIQEPTWTGTEYAHGSGLSIRTADVTVTGNTLHACGASTPITCYRDVFTASGYRNMVFENNLIYDSLNGAYCIRFEDIGSNFKFNNNTVVGPHSASDKGVYYYQSVLYITRFSPECDRATVEFCNNILAGYTGGLHGAGIKCVGNLIHAYIADSWRDQTWLNQNLPGNRVYCWSNSTDTGAFRTSGRIFKGGSLFDQYAFTRPNGESHKVDLGDSFSLTEGSDAIGYANPAYASTHDIQGAVRDASPDAGCYEYGAGGSGPVLAAIGNKNAMVGTLLTFGVTASDPNGDPLTYSASGLPQGATFSNQTFSWTPAAGQAGGYQVTFTVSDGQSQDSETIVITVTVPNTPPVLGSIGGMSVDENESLSFSVSATDADADSLTYSATGLPSGAEFSGGAFHWQPGYDQAGSYQVTFAVSDGQAQDSETVTIVVANVNRPPAMSDVSDRSIDAGNSLQFSISATDPDSDNLTYSASGLPAGANLAGGSFSWTPSANQAGSYEITFTASDGDLQATTTATITVVVADPDATAPVVARCSPEPDAIQVPLNNLVTLHITDAGRGVDTASVVIRVNGQIVHQGNVAVYTSDSGRCSRSGTKSDYRFIYQSDRMFEFDQTVTVTVSAADVQGNVMNGYTYSYTTEMHAFGANKRVSGGASDKDGPAMARDSAGNLWAAWHQGPQGGRDVYVAKLSAGADVFGNPIQLTTDAADQCNPDVAAAGDGKVYVVWQDNRRGNWDIFASVSSDRKSFSREARVSDSNDNEVNPAVAVDHQSPSRVYAVWQDDRHGNQDIYVASSTNSFAASTILQVTTDNADQTAPDLAVDSVNNAYVVWTDGRGGQVNIYGAGSSAGPWTNVPVVTAAGDQTDPAVAAEPDGSTLHLLWVNSAAGKRDIHYASSVGLPSSPLTGVNIVDDTSGADQTAPTIACAQNHKAFACWQDSRHVGGSNDTDLYFAELSAGAAGTNVLVGDDSSSTGQLRPAIGVDAYGQPCIVWTDDRDSTQEIYYVAATFIDPDPLDSKLVAASAGAVIGTDPATIDDAGDISIVVPAGACQTETRITISRILNPQMGVIECLGSYDFGPSGIDFDQPVTVTIPYRYSAGEQRADPYWYDSLTGALSQRGITEVENIVVNSSLNALRFKTAHFTPFYVVASASSDSGVSPSGGSDGGGGGCSVSATGSGSPAELAVPYAVIALVMTVLRRRDNRRHGS